MRLKLIDFNTAKLAKEVQFNELCNWVYKERVPSTTRSYGWDLYKPLHHSGSNKPFIWEYVERKNSAMLNASESRYTAPTQALLKQWLREIHNIHIESKLTSGLDYSFTVYKGLDKMYESLDGTYEVMLEKALFEALKIIKDGKNS